LSLLAIKVQNPAYRLSEIIIYENRVEKFTRFSVLSLRHCEGQNDAAITSCELQRWMASRCSQWR